MTESQGLVIARHRREILIEDADGNTIPALVRGRRLKPLTGDRIVYKPQRDGTTVIHDILPRKTVLERIDNRGRNEGVAANISLLAVVIAPETAPDWQLVDRYLAAAALMNIDAAVIRNKQDIADALLDQRLGNYRDIGYATLATSAETGSGIAELGTLLSGQRSVLVGQSGVGKSSLINALLNSDTQAVSELSERRALGRHTTTASTLFRLPGGGELIDSPGVRRYAPSITQLSDLPYGFVEFRERLHECRFANCRHISEPDCAIIAAVNSGDILKERYDSYRGMIDALEPLKAR